MASTTYCPRPAYGVADISSLADGNSPDSRHDCERKDPEKQDRWAVCLIEPTVASLRRRAAVSTRRSIHNTTAMPVTTGGPSLLSSLPTFMSVFGSQESSENNASLTSNAATLNHRPPPRAHPLNRATSYQSALSASHTRRGSSATTRSESTEPSPTTTISTVDSTLTEPSPSSSPESPNRLLHSLSHQKDSNQTPRGSSMEQARYVSMTPSPTQPEERSGSPNKRPRNTKNLSINTTGISTKQPPHTAFAGSALSRNGESSTSSLPAVAISKILPTAIPSHVTSAGLPQVGKDPSARPFSEPSSPSFIGPSIQPPRRSKLGLTISTSDSKSPPNQQLLGTPLKTYAPLPLRSKGSDLSGKLNSVPETPALGPLSAMREGDGQPLFSPSMAPNGGMQLPPFGNSQDPTLPTPSFGPEGGMQLPSYSGSAESSPYMKTARPPLDIPRQAFQSPQSSSIVHHTVEHHPSTPLHELPLSREAKTPGYPDGPICIYPPSVYLYHQPTREEALEFDVIINVAREVTNPFLEEENTEPSSAVPESRYKDAGVQCTILPGPEKDLEDVPPSAASVASFSSALERIPSDDEGPETPKAPGHKQKEPEYIHLPWEHNSKVYEDWLRICELIDNRVMRGKRVLVHCQLGVSRSASLIVAYGLYKNPRLTPDEAREQAKKQSKFIDLNMHFMYELGDFKKLLADKFPASQVAKRPGGQKVLSRTMTDSVLVTHHQSTQPMSPIADEAEEESDIDQSGPERTQYATAPSIESTNPGPSSAPAGTQRSPTGSATEHLGKEVDSSYDTSNSGSSAVSMETDDSPLLPHPNPDAPLKLNLPTTKPKSITNSAENTSSLPPPSVNLPSAAHVENEAKGTDALPPPSLNFPKANHTSLQNSAKGRESLPPPNFSLPSSTPRRSLRPMPSLPAGFNSMLPKSNPQSQFPLPGGLSLNIPSNTPIAPQNAAESNLMSPRAAEFTANPLHRSIAGDLAESSLAGLQSPRNFEQDPRSPPTKGESTITRNIDDVLG